MRDDGELLEAWNRGDRAAGDALLERHFAALYRFFANKVEDGIDDLIQETMVACLRGAAGFRGDASFRTWMLTIARHQLYKHWRSRRPTEEIGELSLADLATTPSGVVARRREHQRLLAALRTLPLDLQVAIELFYWEKLDGPDLAEVLGVPEGTVRSRLRRARDLLAERMAALAGEQQASVSARDLDEWAAGLRAVLQRE